MDIEDYRQAITEIFEPISTYKMGAYTAKHILERHLNGLYISTEDFIKLMNALGYKNNKKDKFTVKSKIIV